ncbi:MAG: cyclic nucleotide-binding domain-containing protein [Tepidiformaceae bacterium]
MFLKRREEQAGVLAKVPLFSGLSKKQLVAVARTTDQVSAQAGAVLCRQGHLGREFVLIVEGEARVERDGKKIGLMGAGEFFGEMSLLDGKPRTATVVTETPCEVLVVDGRAFTPLLETVPALQRQILVNLCTRLRDCYETPRQRASS